MDYQIVALKGSGDGLISIDSGALGETTVEIYLYSGSWTKVSSIRHLGLYEREDFIVDYSAVYISPSGRAEMKPLPSSLKNSVFAFYYPWYSSQYDSTGAMSWGMTPPHKPLMGYYSSYDERVIEAHIATAKAAGIDGFISSWGGLGFMEDELLPAILRIAEQHNFTITIYYEFERGTRQLTRQDIVDELTYVIRSYASSDAFLKANGAPVIFVYAASAYGKTPSFWMEVVEGLEENVGSTYLVGDVTETGYANVFNGFHWYPLATPNYQEIFDLYSGKMRLGFRGITWDQIIGAIRGGVPLPLETKFLAFTVGAGYDFRKLGFTEYLDRRDGQTYAEYWEGVFSNIPDGVLINSWNEWYEGKEIEPSSEHGFTYLGLTGSYTSTYKGNSTQTDSPGLAVTSDLGDTLRSGEKSASFYVINTSPDVAAVYINMTVSFGEGLSLTDSSHDAFESYIEVAGPQKYSVLLPLLRPLERVPVSVTFVSSAGSRNLTFSALGFSTSGEEVRAVTNYSIQVVDDQVIVSLEPNESRVGVGSRAPIMVGAHYEYDGLPLDGEVILNDTLVKDSPGHYRYTAMSILDKLHGLTVYSSNTVTVIFDRILSTQTVETLRPGTITINVALTYESDGLPVDEATVTVEGVKALGVGQGGYRVEIAAWGPLFSVDIMVTKPGFTTQQVAISGYSLSNIIVEAAIIVLTMVCVLLAIRRRGP